MWTLFKSLLNLLQYCFCFIFWFLGQKACGILASWPGIETPCIGRQSLNHRTAREFPFYGLSIRKTGQSVTWFYYLVNSQAYKSWENQGWKTMKNRVVVVQLISRVSLFVTPWTVARQAPLSSTISQNLFKIMSIESVMLSNHLILWWNPSSSALNLSQHQGLFQWVSSSHQMTKVLEFQLQHQSFQWIFRTDFLQDWLVWSPCKSKGTLKSLLQHQSSKASIFQCWVFFVVQLSRLYMTTGKTMALTRWTFVSKVKIG